MGVYHVPGSGANGFRLVVLSALPSAQRGRNQAGSSNMFMTMYLAGDWNPNPWPSRVENLFNSSHLPENDFSVWHTRPFMTLSLSPCKHIHTSLPLSIILPFLDCIQEATCEQWRFCEPSPSLTPHSPHTAPSSSLQCSSPASHPAPCSHLGNSSLSLQTKPRH